MTVGRIGVADASPPWVRWALVAILVFAALLRFYRLDHDLARTSPDFDEMHNFVDPILRMARTGSFDPQVYSGYPGAFNQLAFFPVVLGQKLGGEYGAYVGGRAFVAAVSVLTVLLVFAGGRRALGSGPALLAAALVTVSRADIRSAHHITPDVLIGALGTTLLLLGLLPASERRFWSWSGALSGFATAVKYTGIVLLPAAMVSLIVRSGSAATPSAPRRGWIAPLMRPLMVLLLCSIVAFALAAPYAVLARGPHGAGMEHALKHYYGADEGANVFLQGEGSSVGGILAHLLIAVGLPGLLLALVGAVFGAPRTLTLPAFALAAATLLAIVPANFLFPRHVVPAVPPLALLAAAGFLRLVTFVKVPQRRGALAIALGLIALVPPATSGLSLFGKYLVPPATDQAAEWIEETFKRPAALLAVLPYRLQLDTTRFEVRYARRVEEVSREALPHFDAILMAPPRRGRLLAEKLGWKGRAFEDEDGRRELFILLRPEGERPSEELAPRPARVQASAALEESGAAFDGDRGTEWPAEAGEVWIEAEWLAPIRLSRVEVDAGSGPRAWPQELVLQYRPRPQDDWRTLPHDPIRPLRPVWLRPGSAPGQRFVIRGSPLVAALRILRLRGGPFGLAEVRVFVASPAHPGAEAP